MPVTTPKPPPLTVAESCAVVVRHGRILIVQRGPGQLWEHFWEFPTIHRGGADPAGRSFGGPIDLAEGVLRLTGARVAVGPILQTLRYSVTKHRVELHAHEAVGLSDDLSPGPGLVRAAWESPESLKNYPLGSAGRRLAAWVAGRWANGGHSESDD